MPPRPRAVGHSSVLQYSNHPEQQSNILPTFQIKPALTCDESFLLGVVHLVGRCSPSMDECLRNHIDGYGVLSPTAVPLFSIGALVAACDSILPASISARSASLILHDSSIEWPRLQKRYDATAFIFLLASFGAVQAEEYPSLDCLRREVARLGYKSLLPASTGTDHPLLLPQLRHAHGSVLTVESQLCRAALLEAPARPTKRIRTLLVGGDVAAIATALIELDQSWRRSERQKSKLERKLDSMQEQLAAYQVRSKHNSHLSPEGEFRLWRARNTGHCSAVSLLDILNEKGTPYLVTSSERKAGMCHTLVARQKNFDMWQQLEVQRGTCGRTWSITVVRTDAFSSNAARSDVHKLQVTEVIVAIRSGNQRYVADLLEIAAGNSHEFREVILKQLRNLGIKTWLDEYDSNHLAVFIIVGDDGPDVQGGCRLILDDIKDRSSNVILWRILCLMHQVQRCIRKAAADFDAITAKPVYTTQVMRCANVWRSFGHHRKLKASMERIYGADVAKLHMTTCISQVCRSRWSTFDGPERKLLQGHLGVSPPLADNTTASPLDRALAQMVSKTKGRPRKGADKLPVLDDPASSSARRPNLPTPNSVNWAVVYKDALGSNRKAKQREDVVEALDIDLDNVSQVMSVRAKHSISDLASAMFWVKLMVAYTTRSPYTHCHLSLQKLKQEGAGNYLRVWPALVQRHFLEFQMLLSEDAFDHVWQRVFQEALQVDGDAPACIESGDLLCLIRWSVLANATESVRRFHQWGLGRVAAWPMRFFDMLWAPYDEEDRIRVAVAKAALELSRLDWAGLGDLELFAAKLVSWCASDFDECVSTKGRFSGIACEIIGWVGEHVEGDIQKIESRNSELRLMTTRAPHMNRDLLSARLVVRSSDPDLVPLALYCVLRPQIDRALKDDTRFAPPAYDTSRVIPAAASIADKGRLRFAARLMQIAKPRVPLRTLVSLKLVWQDGARESSFPWVGTTLFKKNLHGMYVTVIDNIVRLWDDWALAYRSLWSVLQELVDLVPWPLPKKCRLEVTQADVEWAARLPSILRWNVVANEGVICPKATAPIDAPVQPTQPSCDEAAKETESDLSSDGEYDWLGDELAKIVEEDDVDESVAEDSDVEDSRIRNAPSAEEVAQVELENPSLPAHQIVALAAAAASDAGESKESCTSGQSDSDSESIGTSTSSSSSSSAASSVGGPGVAAPRIRGPNISSQQKMWKPVTCQFCGEICGQTKYDPHNGGRDPMYYFRLRLESGAFPKKGAWLKRRQVSIDGSRQLCKTWGVAWLRSNRTCCVHGSA